MAFFNLYHNKQKIENILFQKFQIVTHNVKLWRSFYFVLNESFVSLSDELSFLKNFQRNWFEKLYKFHASQKCFGPEAWKKCLKKTFLTFCMFFKFKGSILRLILLFFHFFLLFFNQRYKIEDWVTIFKSYHIPLWYSFWRCERGKDR